MSKAYALPRDPPIPIRADPGALKHAAMRSLTRAVIATCLRAQSRSPSPAADRILAGDKDADLLIKAATSPTTLAGTPGLQGIALAFVDALVPVSASAALIARSLQLTFDGNAEIRIPGLSMPNAVFLGEGAAIPVAQGTSTIDAVLTPYKLMVICHFTNELLLSSNAEAMTRAVLLANVGPSLDLAMFHNLAGVAGVSPPGLLYGVTPITAATGGGWDAMTADIAALAFALAPVAGNGGIVLIASIKQAVALAMSLGGPAYPVLTSSALGAGTVIAVATQALATSINVPAIEASPNALLHEEDTSPLPINIGGVMATPVRSLFQTDSVGLRFKLPVSWALRSPSGVAVVEGASW
jgi:hypothetical protein